MLCFIPTLLLVTSHAAPALPTLLHCVCAFACFSHTLSLRTHARTHEQPDTRTHAHTHTPDTHTHTNIRTYTHPPTNPPTPAPTLLNKQGAGKQHGSRGDYTYTHTHTLSHTCAQHMTHAAGATRSSLGTGDIEKRLSCPSDFHTPLCVCVCVCVRVFMCREGERALVRASVYHAHKCICKRIRSICVYVHMNAVCKNE